MQLLCCILLLLQGLAWLLALQLSPAGGQHTKVAVVLATSEQPPAVDSC